MHALYYRLYLKIYDTHRGSHINTVLLVIQDCEYVAPRVGYTHDTLSAVRQWLDVGSSISCCSCCLQHEGSNVEKQSYEMVNHILGEKKRECITNKHKKSSSSSSRWEQRVTNM